MNHVWVMDRSSINLHMSRNGVMMIPPTCKYCGVDTITAQRQQPETKGAGPCPKLRGDQP
jgi:hypothetical protein